MRLSRLHTGMRAGSFSAAREGKSRGDHSNVGFFGPLGSIATRSLYQTSWYHRWISKYSIAVTLQMFFCVKTPWLWPHAGNSPDSERQGKTVEVMIRRRAHIIAPICNRNWWSNSSTSILEYYQELVVCYCLVIPKSLWLSKSGLQGWNGLVSLLFLGLFAVKIKLNKGLIIENLLELFKIQLLKNHT